MDTRKRRSASVVSPVSEAALIDVVAVATLTQTSPRHVRRLCDAGKLPKPIRLGAAVRWNKAVILDWIADGCPATKK